MRGGGGWTDGFGDARGLARSACVRTWTAGAVAVSMSA